MKAARIDNNQHAIIEKLGKIPGVTVVTGHDDILVGYRGFTLWYEIKNPDHIGKDGNIIPSKIKKSQKALLETWRGHYRVVWDYEQIREDLKIIMDLPVLKK